MPTQNIYPWQRVWNLREKNADVPDHQLDDLWFSKDRPQTQFTSSEINRYKCLILLGEPGIGKSVAIEELEQQTREELLESADDILYLDLRSFTTDQYLKEKLFKSENFVNWINGSHKLFLFLDSLDECLLRIETVTDFLLAELRPYPVERLYLRVTCRTADLPNNFEDGLRLLWKGEDEVAVYELAPLTDQDVWVAAEMSGLDVEAFWAEIQRAEAIPFAIKPITLQFLINLFTKEGKLPSSKSEIYQRGCQVLCEEMKEGRRKNYSDLSVESRVKLASRIAYFTIFANRYAVWKAADLEDVPDEDITLNSLLRGEQITQKYVLEVLNTGLFTSRGQNRFGWAHQTYAEFLAAQFVIDEKFSIDQILSLVTSDGKLIPQLQQTVAWLAGMDQALFDRFITYDSQALLQSDISSLSTDNLANLVEKFLAALDNGELVDDYRLSRNYIKLQHPGLPTQLQPYIRDKSKNFIVRRVSIEIAETCERQELEEDLLEVALDGEEEYEIRRNAAYSIWRIGSSQAQSKMKTLLNSGDEDPRDELTGYALLSLWPNHLTAKELFEQLRPSKFRHFLGGYRTFLHRFSESLKPEHMPVALDWVEQNLHYLRPSNFNPSSPKYEMELIIDNIMRRAWDYADDSHVLKALAKTAIGRIKNHQPIIGDELGTSFGFSKGTESSFADIAIQHPIRRRLLIQSMLQELVNQNVNIHWFIIDTKLFRNEDLPWLLEQWEQQTDTELGLVYTELIFYVANLNLENCIHLVFDACEKYHGTSDVK